METNSVERLYNRRFWTLAAVGVFMICFCVVNIVEPFFPENPVVKFLHAGRQLFLTLMLLSVMLNETSMRAAKKNPELLKVLNDELEKHNRRRACEWGFGAAVITAMLLGEFANLFEGTISAKSACYIILLASFGTMATVRLILMKR